MGETLMEAGEIYDQLWARSSALLKSGQLRVDPLLRNRAADARRGVTLVARPDATVQRKVESFLHNAATICPGQHFYQTAELHLTVMAIISGSEFWESEIRILPECQAILNQVLRGSASFRVDFRGITVSADAVMIQGFPADNALSRLRDELRAAFEKHRLAGNLDRRYRTTTAHLTVMRFSDAQADWRSLHDYLKSHRETDFGHTRFQSLQLIWGDWYASADTVRILQEHPLKI